MSFARSIIINYKAKLGVILFFLLSLVFFLLYKSAVSLLYHPKFPPFNLLAYLIVIIFELFLMYVAYKLTKYFFDYLDLKIEKWEKDANNAQLGLDGEEIVLKLVTNYFDPLKYYTFKNVELPFKLGDIDIIVLGPKGLYTIEVKNFRNSNYIFKNDGVYYRNSSGFMKYLYKDIRKTVDRRAKDLECFLYKYGINESIPIHKVIVGVNGSSFNIIGNTTRYKVQLRNLENLKTYFDGTFVNGRFTPELCGKIAGIISKLKMPEVVENSKVGPDVNFVK